MAKDPNKLNGATNTFQSIPEGWAKKDAVDDAQDRYTPLPTQVISNEEFVPMPQSQDQKKVETRILEMAEDNAKSQGMSRRDYLRTSAGMAVAFMAMNEVFGDYFIVNQAEAAEHSATQEMWPKKEFIFDVQLHHVKRGAPGPLGFRRLAAMLNLNKDLIDVTPKAGDLELENFTKEVFFDSDTLMGVITGADITGNDDINILPTRDIMFTRDTLNEVAGSKRMLGHGLASPNLPNGLDMIDQQAEEFKPDAWKCYTGIPVMPWNLDDEKVAYPFYEKALKHGINIVNVHKGLPLPGTAEQYTRPSDVRQAALDWPDINFVVYHSGFKNLSNELPPGDSGMADSDYLEWTTDILEHRKETEMPNVYMELGSVFGHTAITHPEICSHLMGQLIREFGSDHVIWGTDCIWWGSPQWQIEAMRRFQIPQKLQEKWGYAAITDEDKRKIFGLNAAKLYNVDVNASLTQFPNDTLSRLKEGYQQEGAIPSNTQYGWIDQSMIPV